jgi:ribonuclease HII
VVAAAIVLSRDEPIPGLHDSKLLTEGTREKLFDEIHRRAAAVGVGIVPPETIDRINILQATRLAMTRAVLQLQPHPDYLLIDGPISLDLDIPQQSIVKGDRLSVSVAAASIIAKVTRDRIMTDLHKQYPAYGFDKHKGYGTMAHKQAIRQYGPSPVHRLCFRGVKG